MVIWTLAKKDLRLLARDARAMIILLAMPLIFILVLGVSLGDNFGQKPAAGLRVSVVDEDEGVPRFFDRPAIIRDGMGGLATMPSTAGGMTQALAGCSLAWANHATWFPHEKWSKLLIHDLNEAAGIQVEFVTRAEAEQLVRSGRRAAVLVIGKNFSKRVQRCSFLASGWHDAFDIAATYPRPADPVLLALRASFHESQDAFPLYIYDGINPFHADGVNIDTLDIQVMRDPTQQTAAAIIDQVAQVSLVRVIMPWMIGRAFEKVGDPSFLELLGSDKQIPFMVRSFLSSPLTSKQDKKNLSAGLQNSLQNIFERYNLTAKTWAALTKEHEKFTGKEGANTQFKDDFGKGLLRRGGTRYQLLVPSYLVMFAFFLVLTVGWLFVAERRQGTMKRLVVAPITKGQILFGKMLPCLGVSVFQGFFLFGAGKLIFDMAWGPQPLWLAAVIGATSFAAIGLAMLVAALARTETQVAIYGTLLVLVLAGLSGCLMGDRSLMPDQMQTLSRITPHAWALDAYRQLLTTPTPDVTMVAQACGVLVAFGAGFLALAWWRLSLD
ncbi:MAG TPA: ABC transporter permease [Gemmataceae bacterium]|nr:ABC transporter permease [Gemmataceae bacterium]